LRAIISNIDYAGFRLGDNDWKDTRAILVSVTPNLSIVVKRSVHQVWCHSSNCSAHTASRNRGRARKNLLGEFLVLVTVTVARASTVFVTLVMFGLLGAGLREVDTSAAVPAEAILREHALLGLGQGTDVLVVLAVGHGGLDLLVCLGGGLTA
jgi:hypothetical protein